MRVQATRHAEMVAIDSLFTRCNGAVPWSDLELYVSCEPCVMCAAALAQLGIGVVYFGCANDKFGGCGSVLDLAGATAAAGGVHGCNGNRGRPLKVHGGVEAAKAVDLLRRFYSRGNPRAPVPHRPLAGPNQAASNVQRETD